MELNHFSFESKFWFSFKPHLITFGFESLPKDIHFTLVFDERQPDINFHVTKNASNPKNKPQIKIAIIDKKVFEEVISEIGIEIIKSVLEPISFEQINMEETGYLSFDRLEEIEEYSLSNLHEIFKEIIHIKRKKRLKIQGDIDSNVIKFTSSKFMETVVYNNIIDFPIEYDKPVDGGLMITNENVIQVIRINENWYKFNLNSNPLEALKSFVEPELINHLIKTTKDSIEILTSCETFSDSQIHNNPVRLIWDEKTK
ncbi:hypothetical protein [Flavobacterium wongokense]|uniref:hypothetical protein n=1 Tax=Flavobacterium wongokense TaxID=2910674 RepID=UPI001F2D96D9|nr:hypothetical protein [Flavobacterium sp. WG47]MCF6131112.1 hypothetical protein [Flavobacterium sp. WG47]